MSKIWPFLLMALLTCITFVPCVSTERSFGIDYENNTFIKDGRPFHYVSGSMHYSRVPYQYWEDRLRKMYAAGLDAVQVYVPWNVHQPEPDQYEFEGQNDIVRFLELARDTGLLVILRAGPYICAEWDYGGFPYWLKQNNQSMILRSMDPGYIKPMTTWFSVFLPKIQPLLYRNNGPVIMVQIENEYGSYRGVTCDHVYMGYLRDLFHKLLGNDVVLFTTDGAGESYLQCGAIQGAYATVDFGPGNASRGLAPMRKWNPKGPLVNSEYYTGWLDYWGGNWSYTSAAAVTQTLADMLNMAANVNLYTFVGASNFGYMNGADPPYVPVVTSYDFNAPLTESGDITNKYLAIRSLLAQYKPVPPDVPPNTTKEAYGTVTMKKMSTVFDALSTLSPSGYIQTTYPITMEHARQAYGFALYRHILTRDVADSVLDLSGVRDRAYVMLDGDLVGMVYRNSLPMRLRVSGDKGQKLDILVENMGRLNYGGQINQNQKGIITNVTLGKVILAPWQYYNVDLSHASTSQDLVFKSSEYMEDGSVHNRLGDSRDRRIIRNKHIDPHETINYSTVKNGTKPDSNQPPTLYRGSFVIGEGQVPADTFLNVCGWNKGQAFINGFNLGRYWPTQGPQVTLYVPGLHIKPHPQTNYLVLLELEGAPGCHGNKVRGHGEQTSCSVLLQKTSILGAKCTTEGAISIARARYDNTGLKFNAIGRRKVD